MNLIQRRARQQAAIGPRMLVANRVVVGIEEHPVSWVEMPVTANEAFENERFEKPRCVGQMPLDRTRVGHRLQRAVLGRQRHGKLHGGRPHGVETVPECGRLRAGRTAYPARGASAGSGHVASSENIHYCVIVTLPPDQVGSKSFLPPASCTIPESIRHAFVTLKVSDTLAGSRFPCGADLRR